jgi:hypothetical protein
MEKEHVFCGGNKLTSNYLDRLQVSRDCKMFLD